MFLEIRMLLTLDQLSPFQIPSPILPLLAEMSGSAISVAWGVMLFCIILGLLVTLSPSRRTTEIKRAKEE
jgi:hypothetical protein